MTENGTRLNFKPVARTCYAQAHSNFALDKCDAELLHEDTMKWLKNDRDVPVLLIVFNEFDIKEREKAKAALGAAGLHIMRSGIVKYSYTIVDASKISWFAYNQ